MKTLGRILLFVFLSSLMLVGAYGSLPAQNPAPASLSGRVVDKVSGGPIRKATVRVPRILDPAAERGAAGTTSQIRPEIYRDAPVTAETAVDGSFAFAALPPGDYQLTVTMEHYLTYEHGQRIVSGKGTLITLRAGERIESLSLPLTKKGAITGTIVDPNGLPLPNVEIRIYTQYSRFDLPNPQFSEVGVRTIRGDVGMLEPFSSKTDNLGRYRMEDLEHGDYYVAARVTQNLPSDSALVEGVRRLTGGAPGRGRGNLTIPSDVPIPVFYPNATDADGARSVYVPPAGEIQGINMTLRPVESAVVKGSVLPPAGAAGGAAGTSGVRVGLFPVGPGSGLRSSLRAITTANVADGTFQITGVRPGRYKVIAVSGQGDRRVTAIIQEVDVRPAGVETLTLKLQRAFDITGQAILETPLPPNSRVGMWLDEDYGELGGFERTTLAPVNPDGSFVIRNVVPDALYRVTLSNPPGGFMAAARYGDNDVFATRFLTRADETKLQVGFQIGSGRVEVVARDGDKPLGGIHVLLAPRDRSRKGLYRSSESGGNGTAIFYDIIPGDYDLLVFEGAKQDSWFIPRFMEKFGGRGRPVHIEKGATLRETAQVINAEGGLD